MFLWLSGRGGQTKLDSNIEAPLYVMSCSNHGDTDTL